MRVVVGGRRMTGPVPGPASSSGGGPEEGAGRGLRARALRTLRGARNLRGARGVRGGGQTTAALVEARLGRADPHGDEGCDSQQMLQKL